MPARTLWPSPAPTSTKKKKKKKKKKKDTDIEYRYIKDAKVRVSDVDTVCHVICIYKIQNFN